jgi:hypothetical protein
VLQDVVASEQLKTVFTVEGEQETYLHRLVFQSLISTSLDTDDSRALIIETAKSIWSDDQAGTGTS